MTAEPLPASEPLVSFILPVYNEEDSVELFSRTLTEALEAADLGMRFEFVYVNDGSADGSLEHLHALAAADDRVQVIDFSRNFGHQIAVTAGIDHASGDAAVIMDTDLQDPPRVAVELIRRWREGFNVVYAQRRTRKDTFFKKATAGAFYRTLALVAEIDIPRDTGDFRLIDRKVIDAVKRFPERNRFLRGMVSYVGFRQTSVQFDRDERHAGVTGYPLRKMIKFAADGILGFSTFPLKLIQLVGLVVSALSALAVVYVLVSRAIDPSSVVPGWTFTVIAILFVGGVQIMMLSVLGSYLGRVYAEVQNRPLYLVASHVGRPAGTDAKAGVETASSELPYRRD
ncbi:glycosyltransferase family 2 protein [Clavibacter tessellarius]|uniref:Glycosyltransferase n=1 Tax=Clavibacter tessellarius TaxID=31965 RepID=A0A225C3L7_9MICO|nr:glycosyltransferase family 2 protein [Clavibacter michiganensis]OQJ61627.1 glycosyltransferase [Clavibacter michiganensis subsp. tessellarius]UKF32674.1 glycosyltransferase family 2 protein [Clavibacter michiganensis subsp. tessellarius]